jgi:hypothetical protein
VEVYPKFLLILDMDWSAILLCDSAIWYTAVRYAPDLAIESSLTENRALVPCYPAEEDNTYTASPVRSSAFRVWPWQIEVSELDDRRTVATKSDTRKKAVVLFEGWRLNVWAKVFPDSQQERMPLNARVEELK